MDGAGQAEISKAVLGQTLTTEVGDVGSYAAASAHNLVREDLASADRRRISAAFNRLAQVYTFYNFGGEVIPPLFQFVKDEDLQTGRAERDTKLYGMGWRPKKTYISREYSIPEDDFDLQEDTAGEDDPFGGFSRNGIIPEKEHPANCPCGCHNLKKKRSLFRKAALLFASKAEQELEKDNQLMEKFDETIIKAAQQETNETVDAFIDATGNVQNFDDAFKAVTTLYDRRSPEKCAALLDEILYASGQISGKAQNKKGGRNG
ncbi:hypothetical protein AGMMS50233_11290 [Endomicrobiia bacterium]|nr:hypothetical protein AGMMS50233_11290 [Endomicrobiia bacterium]